MNINRLYSPLSLLLMMALVHCSFGLAQTEQIISIAALPENTEAFIALRDEFASTPEGGAAVFVIALNVYAQDPDLGLEMLTIAIDSEWLVDNINAGYKGKAPSSADIQRFEERIRARPYVAHSYIWGTSPENAYEIPDGPLAIGIRIQDGDVENETARIFVFSSGADSPRPIRLDLASNGYWKANSWSSLLSGIVEPKANSEDEL